MVIAVAPARAATILAFGDSLIEGHGLPAADTFSVKMEAALRAEGLDVKVINAAVNGDTTSGGLTRLAFVLDVHNPDYVILELGANDMLRAIPPEVTRKNLRAMLDVLKERRIPVLLAGMRSFRNLSLFGDAFQDIYEDLADEYDTVYYPFFLSGVALEAPLNQDDGLHPNAAGVDVIVDKITPYVKKLLKKRK